MRLVPLLILAIVGLSGTNAMAANPWDSYGALDCQVDATLFSGGTSGTLPVCEVDGAGNYECDLTTSLDSVAIWAVTDTTNGRYVIWGTVGTSSGGQFFCTTTTTSTIVIRGTDLGDDIRLVAGVAAPSWPFTLSPLGTDPLSATVTGGTGNDTLYGSASTAANFSELIDGEGDNDTIYGHDGTTDPEDEVLEGGTGDDVIIGGPGAERQEGEDGNDNLSGNGGNDILNGGEGSNVLLGGSGEDAMDGEEGSDVLCGDLASDVLYSGEATGGLVVDVDTLWGGPLFDDTCEGPAGPGSWVKAGECENTSNIDEVITDQPSECGS